MKKKFLGLPVWLWIVAIIVVFFWHKLQNLYYLIFKKGVSPHCSVIITWSNWWTVKQDITPSVTTGSNTTGSTP